MKIRDRQKSAVYQWENDNVAPEDTTIVPFNRIQGIINWVWEQEGLQHPPLADHMPKQARCYLADSTRTHVRFGEKTFTWIILHELAHSCTSTVDGKTNLHGSLFLGVYIQLLHRYLRLPYAMLVTSAEKAGLKVKLDARPVFL